MKILKQIKDALGTIKHLYYNQPKEEFGHYGDNFLIERPYKITHPENIFIGNDVAIRGFFTFISHTGRLYIKDHCDISQFLTVVTGNHTVQPPLDKWQIECNHTALGDKELNTIIEEDVWIGIRCTLMPGVTIGRGSIIGACSVVTKNIPPYSIAVGNPCKVIRVKYTYDQIMEREFLLYSPDKRLSPDIVRNLFKSKEKL